MQNGKESFDIHYTGILKSHGIWFMRRQHMFTRKDVGMLGNIFNLQQLKEIAKAKKYRLPSTPIKTWTGGTEAVRANWNHMLRLRCRAREVFYTSH
ncbi:hypothetical protein TNCV_565831 [Trichonephila clavipes]|nr:hypothetical protein TNCV_565831 [Trichonephila clavipes]